MYPSFSIREAIQFGWDKTRVHSALVFQVVLTIFALYVLQAMVGHTISNTALGFMANVVIVVLQFVIGVGATVIVLKLAKGTPSHYRDLIPPARLAWHFLLASLLAGLIVLCGLILLIIPGIYFALRYSMVRFCIIDGDGVKESLRHSRAITEGVKWELLGFFIVLILLNLLGAVLLLVGLLVTLPVSMLAAAHVYLKLKSHHHGA